MRVKSHQIRAKVAFTKPLTTYLMRGKGDFSCRVYDVETIYNTTIKTFARLMYLVFLSRWSVLKRAANCLHAISELRFACVKRVFLKTIHMETCSTYRNIVITKVSRNDPFSNTGTRETRKLESSTSG